MTGAHRPPWPQPPRRHLGNGDVPQLAFLHLAAGRHGEGLQHHGVARDLQTRQLPPAEGDQGLLGVHTECM